MTVPFRAIRVPLKVVEKNRLADADPATTPLVPLRLPWIDTAVATCRAVATRQYPLVELGLVSGLPLGNVGGVVIPDNREFSVVGTTDPLPGL